MLDFVLLFLLGAILALFLYKQCNNSRLVYYANLIPGPRRIPIFGLLNPPMTGQDTLRWRSKLIETYGHVVKYWLGDTLYVLLSDPQDVEVILGSRQHIEKGGSSYKILLRWLGTGLLTSGGIKWHARRKALTPTFHFKILEQFIDVFNSKGNILLEKLQQNACDEKIFDVQKFISNYTLDVICETAMGVSINAQDHDHSPYIEAVMGMNEFVTRTRYKNWILDKLDVLRNKTNNDLDKMLETLHGFTNSVIKAKRGAKMNTDEDSNNTADGEKKKTAFLELLLNLSSLPDSSIKTDEDIREEVDTFMFEGHDTTSSVLSSTVCMLAKHQDIQEKLFQEVQEIIKYDNYNLSYTDLQNLKYTEMIIKEALRLYPSVPSFARSLTKDVQLPSGYTLAAGTQVIINAYHLHRNTKYYQNPEEYNPDNFLPQNSASRHPYAFIPFSAGPRNCIGQKFAMLEMKSFLSKLVYKYKIEYGGQETDMQTSCGIILKSENGYLVKLSQRNSKTNINNS